jgi:hypothetical protein
MFSIIPSNGFLQIDDNTVEFRSIKQIKSINSKINIKDFPEYENTFQKEPMFDKTLGDIFNKIVLKYLYEKLQLSNLQIVKDAYNVYYIDKDNDRHFVFDIDIKNVNENWIYTFKCYIIVKNVNSILLDSGEYDINILQNKDNIDLEMINMIIDIPRDFNVNPNQQSINNEEYENYYRILNKLHLMDPYITSGKDMIISDEMKNKFELDVEKKRSKFILFKKYECYNKDTFELIQNINTNDECLNVSGIWDSMPENSTLCPFYQKNKNYPNNFGELQYDGCQLPQNMKRIGYKYYSLEPSQKPLCYNCKSNLIERGSLGFCCEEQNDKTKYPLLSSPDYAFENDIESRQKYSDLFLQKNLNVK